MNKKLALFGGLFFGLCELWLWSQFVSTHERPHRVELQNAFNDSSFVIHAQELRREVLSNPAGATSSTVFSADFQISEIPKYLDSVTLQFVTFAGPPLAVRAEMDIGSCSASREEMILKDNEYRQFSVDRACAAALTESGGNFRVRLIAPASSAETKLGVWTRRSQVQQAPQLPHIATRSSDGDWVYATGNYDHVGSLQPLPKLQRLSWVWSPALAEHWILVGVLLNLSLVVGLLGLAQLLWRSSAPMGSAQRGVWAFFAILGMGCTWAFVAPPFQAPDEPDHVLSYVQLARPGVSEAPLAEFAKRIHFERIKFHPLESFQTADMATPYAVAWSDHVSAPDAPTRSPAAALLWRGFAKIADPLVGLQADPGLLLLKLRLLNVLTIGLAFAGSLTLMSAGKVWQLPTGWWAALTWFMIMPNLAFFFASVNTYTALFVGLVIFTTALCAAESDCVPRAQSRTPAQWLGLLLHGGVLLVGSWALFAGGLTGVVYYFVFLALLLIAALRQRANEGQWTSLFLFSLVGPGLFWVTKGVFPGYDLFGRSDAPAFFWYWLLGGVPVGLVALLLCRSLERWTTRPGANTLVRVTASLALFLWLYASLIFVQDGLHNIEKDPSLSRELYVWDALKSFLMSAALGAPDYYTAETFWSPFGWLESMWHPAATKALQILTLVGLVRMGAHWIQRSQTLLAFLRLGLFVGLVGALAYGFHSRVVNLHGRYMVGVYLIAFAYAAIGWTHLVRDLAAGFQKIPTRHALPAFAWAAAAVLQVYAVAFVLNRFF